MAQPFNYTIQAPSAFESLVSGLRLGTSLEEMRLQQEQRAAQVAQAQQKAMQEQQQPDAIAGDLRQAQRRQCVARRLD
jgi:hypothetical protein